jgi:hypothetical protein
MTSGDFWGSWTGFDFFTGICDCVFHKLLNNDNFASGVYLWQKLTGQIMYFLAAILVYRILPEISMLFR